MNRRYWAIAAALGAVICLGQATHVFFNNRPKDSIQNATTVLRAQRIAPLVAMAVAAHSTVNTLNNLLNDKYEGVSDSCTSFHVGGKIIISRPSKNNLSPASGMKLFVASVALDKLGANYRYKTTVYGDLLNGEVKGNLYVRGGGDPLVATDMYAKRLAIASQPYTSLDRFADQIQRAGIKNVDGTIVVDDSRYDRKRSVQSWGERYIPIQVAPLSALEINDNHGDNLIGLAGDPAIYFGTRLQQALQNRGVVFGDDEVKTGAVPTNSIVLATATSHPLFEIVDDMLTNSNNTTAELLVKELGRKYKGEGTTAAGLAFIKNWIVGKQIDNDRYVQADGSGLSDQDAASCQTLNELIDANIGDIRKGFAIAGETGTLRTRLKGTPAESLIHAKTGTLNGAASLSGFVQAKEAPLVTFSLISDGLGSLTGNHIWQDDMATALASFSSAYASNLAAQ
jgi:D-alanyl-D-alanine carboxypeptidase/D-alanyl-D-alanine-endopeptidase (penicillin-binding protein 4)